RIRLHLRERHRNASLVVHRIGKLGHVADRVALGLESRERGERKKESACGSLHALYEYGSCHHLWLIGELHILRRDARRCKPPADLGQCPGRPAAAVRREHEVLQCTEAVAAWSPSPGVIRQRTSCSTPTS